MTNIPPEAADFIGRLIACNTNLTYAIKNQNKETALDATIEAAVLFKWYVSHLPGIKNVGIRTMTADEEKQFKQDLLDLLR